MPISVVFDPPLPSDSPSTFNNKAFTLLGDLNDWSTQANALPGEVATNLSALLAAPPAIGSTTPAAGSFTTLSVNTVSTDVKAVVGSSVAKATTASTEVVWVKSSDVTNAITLAIGIHSNATASSRGAYLQVAEQGVAYRNLLIQPDGGNTQIGSPSGSGAVTIPGTLGVTGTTTVGNIVATYSASIADGANGGVLTFRSNTTNSGQRIWSILTDSGGYGRFAIKRETGYGTGVTTDALAIDNAGAVTIPGSLSLTGGTFGYGIGAGGTVTQATSKSTDVTLNKPCGQITMDSAALAAGTSVGFVFNNSFITPSSLVVANITGFGSYLVDVVYVGSGGCQLRLTNTTGGSVSEAVVINFAVISGASS